MNVGEHINETLEATTAKQISDFFISEAISWRHIPEIPEEKKSRRKKLLIIALCLVTSLTVTAFLRTILHLGINISVIIYVVLAALFHISGLLLKFLFEGFAKRFNKSFLDEENLDEEKITDKACDLIREYVEDKIEDVHEPLRATTRLWEKYTPNKSMEDFKDFFLYEIYKNHKDIKNILKITEIKKYFTMQKCEKEKQN